jgi:hypothetical protein
MAMLRFVISQIGSPGSAGVVTHELRVSAESAKRLTTARVARLLARTLPGFRRRKGRYSISAGSETLPVLEATQEGWRAWRLSLGDDTPSGFEPPLPGRVGKLNSAGNPFADRSRGVWECVDISEEPAAGGDSAGQADHTEQRHAEPIAAPDPARM